MRVPALVAAAFLAASHSFAQNSPPLRSQPDPNLRFEVATVRRVEIPADDRGVPVFFPTGGIGASDPTHFEWRGAWLMNLIAEAFGVRSENITGPGWPSKDRYDIV